MPRALRIVAVGVPHHITQRGNARQDVFLCDEDRARYLDFLARYSQKYMFDILAYCLMTNHVHIIGIPRNENGMCRMIQTTHMMHTQAVNLSSGRSGHLWQGRYFSTILDEVHLHRAVRYVEQNPVRAGLVKRAEEYKWSSAACHCGLREDPLLCTGLGWDGRLEDWPELLARTLDDESVDVLRKCTMSGKPCADDEFAKNLLETLGR